MDHSNDISRGGSDRLGRRVGVSPRPAFVSDFPQRSGKMNVRFAFVASVALSAVVNSMALADYDIAPSVSGGQIMTNAFDDGTEDFVSNVRVFAYGFDTPFSTEDPGFHPQPGSGFAGSAAVRIGAVTGLSYWNGAGSPNFGALPNGEALLLEFGSQNLTAGASAPAGTISLGTTDAAGEFDKHLTSTLFGPGATDPTDGLYLIGLQLTSDGLTSSQPFFVIYNTGDDEGLSDNALTYVRDTFAPGSNLVPEPASLSLAGLPILLGLMRRRRI